MSDLLGRLEVSIVKLSEICENACPSASKCHPELVSGSGANQMLKQVQHDTNDFRLDAEYFSKANLQNEKILSKFPSKIGDCLSTKILNVKSLYLNKNFNYLQISDVNQQNGFQYQTVSVNFCDIPDRATYILRDGDICVSTVRPNRNAVAFIKNSRRLVGTSGFCVLRIKNKEKLLPEYLYVFCKTDIFIKKLMRENAATMYPAVSDSNIKDVRLPLLPLDFQEKIAALVKEAHSKLERSKSLYKEAEKILADELGFRDVSATPQHDEKSVPQHDGGVAIRHSERSEESHKKSLRDVSATPQHDEKSVPQHDVLGKSDNISIKKFSDFAQCGRLDAEYWQRKYDEILSTIDAVPHDELGALCEIADANFLPNQNQKYKYIELADIGANGDISDCSFDFGENLPTRARRLVKFGDVLVSSIEGSLQSCAIVTSEYDGALCSTGFYVLRPKRLNSATMLMLIKSMPIQALLKKGCSGTILTAISKDEFAKIHLPILPAEIQEKIAALVQNSFSLKGESRALLESAKSAVEKEIER